MSIRNRLLITLLAVLVLLALNLAVYIWGGEKRSHSVRMLMLAVNKQLHVAGITQQIHQQNQKILQLSHLLESGENAGLTARELATETRYIDELSSEFTYLDRHADSTEQSQIDTLHLAFDKLAARWNTFYAQFSSPSSIARETSVTDFNPHFDKVIEALKVLHDTEKQAIADTSDSLFEVNRLTDYAIFIIFFCSILIVVTLAYTLVRSVRQGFETLKQGAIRIGEGDLVHRIELTSKDEIGNLAQAFNDMSEKLAIAMHEAQAAKELADEANEAKSDFLTSMSHELRTPLNAIIGYSEILQEDAKDLGQEMFLPDLVKILTAGRRLLCLINNILDLSKIVTGRMTLYIETFDVAAMIDDIVATIRPLVDTSSNELKVVVQSDAGSMMADQTKIRQTLLNLLSNACKFTENGTITLEVVRENQGGSDSLRFNVSDSGIGMNKEQLSRVFETFKQADSSTTKSHDGAGLGLSISKQFCQMMGGDIEAKSVVGEGSTFSVRLPSVVSDVTHPMSVVIPQTLSHPLGTVLIIDDDEAVLDLCRRFLTKEGFAVAIAQRGEEGIALAKQLRPIAIALDVTMPHMDGWKVLSVLKGDPDTVEIPVIMMSKLDEREIGFALGATDYMIKPIDRHRLCVLFKKLVDKQGQRGNVLVVEDDETSRIALVQALEQHGWRVQMAENGLMALDALRLVKPKLIFLGLMMPEMNGFEFLEVLRKHEKWRDIPIIVLTNKELRAEDRLQLSDQVQQIIKKSKCTSQILLDQIPNMVDKLLKSNISTKKT